jgi:hypothetical protein
VPGKVGPANATSGACAAGTRHTASKGAVEVVFPWSWPHLALRISRVCSNLHLPKVVLVLLRIASSRLWFVSFSSYCFCFCLGFLLMIVCTILETKTRCPTIRGAEASEAVCVRGCVTSGSAISLCSGVPIHALLRVRVLAART